MKKRCIYCHVDSEVLRMARSGTNMWMMHRSCEYYNSKGDWSCLWEKYDLVRTRPMLPRKCKN